jgi:hypothetical protein
VTWVPEKLIFWSVTVYSKHLCSQCYLTAQIQQVQDNSYFYTQVLNGVLVLRPIEHVGYILPTYDTLSIQHIYIWSSTLKHFWFSFVNQF